jgi:hypothetical protein
LSAEGVMARPLLIKFVDERKGGAGIDVLVFCEGAKSVIVLIGLIGDPFAR